MDQPPGRAVELLDSRYEDGVATLLLQRPDRTLLVRARTGPGSLRSLAERIQ